VHPRTKASLLWGLIGAMAFLVLVQGYELVAGLPVGFGAKLGVALLVGTLTIGLTHAIGG